MIFSWLSVNCLLIKKTIHSITQHLKSNTWMRVDSNTVNTVNRETHTDTRQQTGWILLSQINTTSMELALARSAFMINNVEDPILHFFRSFVCVCFSSVFTPTELISYHRRHERGKSAASCKKVLCYVIYIIIIMYVCMTYVKEKIMGILWLQLGLGFKELYVFVAGECGATVEWIKN